MAVNTIMLDFSVDSQQIKDESQQKSIADNIEIVLRDHLINLKLITSLKIDGGLLKLYTADNGNVITIRLFENGLITVNLEYYKGDTQEPILNYELTRQLEQQLCNCVNCYRSKLLPPIKRGSSIDVYLSTSDERLLEYDIDELVFEERTQYQKVQIVHSKTLGNMLVLDDLQNISEADLIYTETLMARGKENYKDKTILILGGGDGALLYELLKEEPKEIIMLEIDDVVMKACAKYMRSICGNVLDSMQGPNYHIIIGDCMKTMSEFVRNGRKFDYIFGDLTDVPISESPSNGELWNFINQILVMAFKILKDDGKFMTHLIGSASIDALKMYEAQLLKLKPAVKFTTTHAFVPSFLEDWVFCQVCFQTKQ